jgi:hypothetical protein
MRSLSVLVLLAGATVAPAEDVTKLIATKALAATGWGTKGAHATWKDKGKMTVADQTFDYTGDFHTSLPQRYRFSISAKYNGTDIAITCVLDGDKGWESAGGQTRELTGEKLAYVQTEAHQMYVFGLKPLTEDKTLTLAALPAMAVAGKNCVGISVAKPGKPTVKLYFDAATSLPAKLECPVKNEFDNWKDATDEMFPSDWADDNGKKIFKSMKVLRNGKVMLESQLSDQKEPEKVDAKLYEKP